MLQSNQVLSFFRAYERGDWSQPELAEFYRVEDALTKSGVGISTDRGLTDEGEPWFVFFRQDNEEVIVHFARIGGNMLSLRISPKQYFAAETSRGWCGSCWIPIRTFCPSSIRRDRPFFCIPPHCWPPWWSRATSRAV